MKKKKNATGRNSKKLAIILISFSHPPPKKKGGWATKEIQGVEYFHLLLPIVFNCTLERTHTARRSRETGYFQWTGLASILHSVPSVEEKEKDAL